MTGTARAHPLPWAPSAGASHPLLTSCTSRFTTWGGSTTGGHTPCVRTRGGGAHVHRRGCVHRRVGRAREWEGGARSGRGGTNGRGHTSPHSRPVPTTPAHRPAGPTPSASPRMHAHTTPQGPSAPAPTLAHDPSCVDTQAQPRTHPPLARVHHPAGHMHTMPHPLCQLRKKVHSLCKLY